jgi:hypothetical protein
MRTQMLAGASSGTAQKGQDKRKKPMIKIVDMGVAGDLLFVGFGMAYS